MSDLQKQSFPSQREIEKLEALGYEVEIKPYAVRYRYPHQRDATWQSAIECNSKVRPEWSRSTEEALALAWAACSEHARSPDGMRSTMADKVAWLTQNGPDWPSVEVCTEFGSEGPTGWFTAEQVIYRNGQAHEGIRENGASAEAAVDALFWSVP